MQTCTASTHGTRTCMQGGWAKKSRIHACHPTTTHMLNYTHVFTHIFRKTTNHKRWHTPVWEGDEEKIVVMPMEAAALRNSSRLSTYINSCGITPEGACTQASARAVNRSIIPVSFHIHRSLLTLIHGSISTSIRFLLTLIAHSKAESDFQKSGVCAT